MATRRWRRNGRGRPLRHRAGVVFLVSAMVAAAVAGRVNNAGTAAATFTSACRVPAPRAARRLVFPRHWYVSADLALIDSHRSCLCCLLDEGQSLTSQKCMGKAWSYTLAVRDAIYTAIFGAPHPEPGDGAGLHELGDSVRSSVNDTLGAGLQKLDSMVQAVNSNLGDFLGLLEQGYHEARADDPLAAAEVAEHEQPDEHLQQVEHRWWHPAALARERAAASGLAGLSASDGGASTEGGAFWQSGNDIVEALKKEEFVYAAEATAHLELGQGSYAGLAHEDGEPHEVAEALTYELAMDSYAPDELLLAHATQEAHDGPAAEGSGASDAVDEQAAGAAPFSNPDEEGPVKDFFLFIKDYSWTLRYRISHTADSDTDVDAKSPLQMEWVKLKRPLQNPSELLEEDVKADLFDWAVREPPNHHGFMYQVTAAVGSGVEAVINFFKGRGLKLLVQADSINLVGEEGAANDDNLCLDCGTGVPRPVTHCWVQVVGLPFFPVLQQIAFYNSHDVVTNWQA